MKRLAERALRATVALGLAACLFCCQRAGDEHGYTAYLIVDFHDPSQRVLSIPLEIAEDSLVTAYEVIKASGLKYELHPAYASPPSVLLQRIEGMPESLSDDLYWAVFVKARRDESWEYQKVGISEIRLSSGMAVGLSLTRWEYLDGVFAPLDLPRYDFLAKEGANTSLAVQVGYEDSSNPGSVRSIAATPSEAWGCGWSPPGASAKLLPQFSSKTIEESVGLIMKDANKLGHLFAPKHNLGPLVSKLGGQENTVRAVLNAANGKLPASGFFHQVPVQVHGQTVIIRGNVINGVPRLGTMYIP